MAQKKSKQPNRPAAAAPGKRGREPQPARTAWRLFGFVLLVAAAAVLVFVSAGGSDDGDEEAGDVEAASTDIDVQTYEVAAASHVPGRVDYPQVPPVGGDHNQAWMNCGSYPEPIPSEAAVHSLEHGAVWITYDESLPAADRDTVEALGEEPYVLVSPWEGSELPGPVVASAWGAQVVLERADGSALTEFLDTYREADTAPEPGAPCTGGVGAAPS